MKSSTKMEKLTILCIAISEAGHMNATIGIALALKKRGHRVVFAVERSWEGKVEKFGLEERVYDERDNAEKQPGKQWSIELTNMMNEISQREPVEGMKLMSAFLPKLVSTLKYFNSRLIAIVDEIKPNVIIEDFGLPIPALLSANVPIIKLFSVSPLFAFDDERLPPFGCGLPLNDTSGWEQCRKVVRDSLTSHASEYNEWMEKDYPHLPRLATGRFMKSTNLNIYMYPNPLVKDYLKLCPLGDEWIGIDHCLREPFGNFEIPEKLKNGKLIFLTLGSWGSSLTDLMKRLISCLSKSKHKFIVAMGHRHNEYELAENMWGEEYVPQLAVLPHVDLAIIHGGNNSFTEALYFGKPMIILPLLGDQHDNAQRAVEMNIGLKFNPFTVTEYELNQGIEMILSDTNVAENVRRISEQMRESKSMEAAVSKIENVAKYPKFPAIK